MLQDIRAIRVRRKLCSSITYPACPSGRPTELIPWNKVTRIEDDAIFIVPADILRQVDEKNGDRHVTIHTLGFVGADREFMQSLAQHTGGKYSDIK